MKAPSMYRAVRLVLLLTVSTLRPALAEAPKTDVAGSADHSVLSRFTGSVLAGYSQQDWADRSFPDANGADKAENRFARPVTLEGKVTRLFYLAPLGKSPLEVFRNHQQALQAAGFKTTWTCETEAQGCARAYFALDGYERGRGMAWTEGDLPGATADTKSSAWPLAMHISHEQGRMWVGSLSRDGRSLHLLLYTSVAATEATRRAATYVEVVEPKAMPTGQVSVNAQALGKGLATEGKVAVRGLFFDTGKADLLPSSKPQLDEMAKLLQGQPGLKAYLVGHTDNVGAFDANLALSQARAQAVVTALTAAPYRVDAKRLAAKGASSMAPMASNADEAGRALNRRVELVVQ